MHFAADLHFYARYRSGVSPARAHETITLLAQLGTEVNCGQREILAATGMRRTAGEINDQLGHERHCSPRPSRLICWVRTYLKLPGHPPAAH